MNEKKDVSSTYNSIFDQNSQEEVIEADKMNRDYLYHIYDDEMASLNKEIRMTRTGYLRERVKIEESFGNEIKNYRKNLRTISVISGVVIGIAVVLFIVAAIMISEYMDGVWGFALEGKNVNNAVLNLTWYYGAMVAFVGILIFILGALIFLFFGGSAIKAIKRLKKNKARALQSLEDMKEENMLAGTYDASK